MAQDNQLHFEVHPSVVYQLGESLISNPIQALIELVKNSYDADASYAKVTIDTHGIANVDGEMFSPEGGRIMVEDNGVGMTLTDIKNGWLTISNRKKQELKRAKKTTPGGRTPLGDKGLGRLGVQRLGEKFELFTEGKDGSGYHFGFSWLAFETAPKLEGVDVHLRTLDCTGKKGTKIIVSGLKERDFWRGQGALKHLEQELSQVISPYREIRNFMVLVLVDGKKLELVDVSERIRNIAPVRYKINFDGAEITIEGRVRLDHFRPANAKEAEQFALIAESDNGDAFFDFLQSQLGAPAFNLRRAKSTPWFAEFSWTKSLANLDKVQRASNDDIANPGPFRGEVDSFDLSDMAFRGQSVFDKRQEYRQYVKDLSGIRVYRDGFAIKVDHDWLKLSAQWTSATSYYGLKPDNTIGYIALSARDNIELEETTDREGFKESPHYRNFLLLLQEFKTFTTRAHDFFGRSWIDFRKKRNEIAAQIDSRKTTEDLSKALTKGLAEAPQHRKKIDVFKARLTKGVSASKEVVECVQTTHELTPELRQKMADAMSELEPLLIDANKAIEQLSKYLDALSSLQGLGQVLEDRIDGLRRQMDYMYETVGLGLTAEALSHEVYNVADQLAVRAKSAQTRLRNKSTTERPILAFVEYVLSAVMALRKQMSFLSPALRHVREQRHSFDIADLFSELAEFYQTRLSRANIAIRVISDADSPLNIRINKGKLTQIIDNLVLNSEYWLKEDIAQERLKSGTITFEISRPFLRIWDDGCGVDPSVEHALFEPFVSSKKEGRGLGLFIIKQLLDSEGCSIGLVPERNSQKRLFKFQIDLRSVLNDDY
ncbi:MAG: ATP-binding protein [Deltaproteobacteria bacterium]|jgi:signal transduction histidine kinase|nr:ATP-binding protein [Deltaproteobacteria bacterium]